MNSRCVEENQLGGGRCQNPEDAVPGGLRFFGDNRDLLPEHAVDQSGLPHIRTPQNGDISGAKFFTLHESAPLHQLCR